MYFNWKRYTIGALLSAACLPFVLAGCGDYAGKGGAAGAIGTQTTITGKAVAGPIKNATVQVFKLLPNGQKGDPIGEPVRTDLNGSYTLNFPNPGVPVMVVVSGSPDSTYTDEYGNTMPFGSNETIRTVVAEVTATADKPMTVQVTPVTELAAQLVQSSMGTTLSSDIKAAVQAANITIGKKIGVDNIVELQPAVVNDAASVKNSTPEQINYGLVLAGLAKLQQDAPEGKPISQVISAVLDTPEKTATLAAAIVDFTRTSVQNATEIKDIPPALSQTIANAATVQPPTMAVQQDTQAPSAPANLSATSDRIARVEISWSASTDNERVDGYSVYRDGQNIGKASGTNFTDNRVEPGKSYKYQVKAVDAAGNISAAGNEASGATPPPPQAPAEARPLTEPGALAAVAVTNDTVRFTWNAATDGAGGVAGYNIYRDGKVVATLAADNTTYTDTSLSGFTQYRYKVEAFDAAGNRKTSGDLAVTTKQDPATIFSDNTPPSQPFLTRPTLAVGSVRLTWTAATDNVGVAGYKVYRDGQELATLTGTTFSDVTVLPNTAYSYHAIAFDAAGNVSAAGNSVTVTTPVDPAQTATARPAAPTNLAAANVTSGTAALTWSSPAAVGYAIYRDGVRIGTSTQPAFSDSAVLPDATFVYTVTAFDLAGNESVASSPLSIVTPLAPVLTDQTAPTTPAGLAVTTLGSSLVSFSWTASTDSVGVAGYEIIRMTLDAAGNPLSETGQLIATRVLQTGYADNSVVPDTTYKYAVRAYDAAGNRSAASDELSVKTQAPPATADTTAPAAPTGLAAAEVTASSVRLVWTPSTDNVGVAGYDVYRAGSKIATVTQAGYIDATVFPDNTYVYTVIAFDAAGNRSVAGAALSAATLPRPSSGDLTPPGVPANLAVSNVAMTSVTLSWSASTDNIAVAGYEIYRNGVKLATAAQTSYTDTTFTADAAYKYQVTAYDAAGNRSAASNELIVTLAAPDSTPPSVPANLGAASVTGSAVVLAWSPATDNMLVAGYHVYRNDNKKFTSTEPAYTDTAVFRGTRYTYQVTAFDAKGNESAASAAISVTTPLQVNVDGELSGGIISQPVPDTTAPTAPANLAAATFATSADKSTVILTWNPSTDNVAVTGYEIWRDGAKVATVTQPGYTLANVASGATSVYHVVAYDAAGNRSGGSNQLPVKPNQVSLGVTVSGALSAAILGLPGMDITAPTAPDNISAVTFATTASTSSVVLTWNASTDNTGVAGYEVYRENTKIATVTQRQYTDSNLLSGAAYKYFVIAYDATGNRSVASNQLSVTPNQAVLNVSVSGQISEAILGM